MSRIGLVAGQGKLPIMFADAAREKGDTVVAFGVKGITDEALENRVDKLHWINWGDFKKVLFLLATERLRRIALLGKINKDLLFKGDDALDEKAKSILNKVKDRKDYTLLKQAADILKTMGIEIMDSTTYLTHLVPQKSILTKRSPTKDEYSDIEYGKDVAKELARFDIGQAIAVKDKTVIAIEAVEGTDETIRRSGNLSKTGFSLIKVSRPNQDMRFDVPLVGLGTLKVLIEAKGNVLALEAGKTLLIDKDEMVKLADENGVAIVIV